MKMEATRKALSLSELEACQTFTIAIYVILPKYYSLLTIVLSLYLY